MNPGRLTLRPCRKVESDADQVMRWRNDPVTLRMFYHHTPKRWETFWPEFRDTYFIDDDLPPVFAVDGEQPVAFLRFQRVPSPADPARSAIDISINVDPAKRGRGYGKAALLLCADYARSRGVEEIVAEIRVDNDASLRTFEVAGFRRLDTIDKRIDDVGEVCRIHRLVLEVEP